MVVAMRMRFSDRPGMALFTCRTHHRLPRHIGSIIASFVLVLISDEAFAGRLPNPLPVFTEAGETVLLHFRNDGLEYHGRVYKYQGRSTYEHIIDRTECLPNMVGKQRFEVKLTRVRVLASRTDFLGCGRKRLTVARKITQSYRREPPGAVTCRKVPVHLTNGSQDVHLSAGCDGTLVFSSGDFTEVMSRKGRRFFTRGRDGEKRWRISVSPPPQKRPGLGWRIGGRVVDSTYRFRFRGRYRPKVSQSVNR